MLVHHQLNVYLFEWSKDNRKSSHSVLGIQHFLNTNWKVNPKSFTLAVADGGAGRRSHLLASSAQLRVYLFLLVRALHHRSSAIM